MLVDLGRNDLSRVCVPGTVKVERFLEPERFSHVTHLVSEVAGELAEGVTPFDLLRATFPAGTVSGAPKVRAMQIISELEGYRRGTYAGVVGYHVPGVGARHVHRDPHRSPAGRARLPAGGRRHRRRLESRGRAPGVPEQARGPRSGDRGRAETQMILLIDNYDSFTYNLAHLFGELGAEVVVRRNDEITPDEAEALSPSHLVVSPGPGRPEEAGATPEILRRLSVRVPTLGVCLGHQAIVQVFGGEVGQAQQLVHGKATLVDHDGRGIFAGLPPDFLAGRYHSLAATSVPDVFEVSATAADGEVMAVRHTRAADRRRAVPSRVGADAARTRHREELPRGDHR